MIKGLKSMKKRPGVDEILIPGERSDQAMRASWNAGIAIDEETIAEIQRWCDHFGVTFDARGTEAPAHA